MLSFLYIFLGRVTIILLGICIYFWKLTVHIFVTLLSSFQTQDMLTSENESLRISLLSLRKAYIN